MNRTEEQQSGAYQAFLDHIPGAAQQFLYDEQYTIEEMNHGFLEMFGFSKEELSERFHNHFIEMLYPADRQTLRKELEKLNVHRGKMILKCRIICKDGSFRWVMNSMQPICRENGQTQIFSIMLDIDSEKKNTDKLQQRAERDALTGLYNREETERRITDCLMEDPHAVNAMFMIDTDNFKQINDTRGHLFGDAVLTEMAEGMKKLTRDIDVVGRIGGDEFTIFYRNIKSRDIASNLAERLLEMFRNLFRNEKNILNVTCSIGIALSPDNGQDFQSLYRNADLALYRAKNQGKNQYAIFDKGDVMEPAQSRNSALGAAIDSNQGPSGALDNLVSYVFQILYNAGDLGHAIQMILEIVGKRFGVSRAYIFENSEDDTYCDNTYEWCNTGVVPQKEYLQHYVYEESLEYEELFRKDSIFYCRDIYSLKPEQVTLFENQGIKATLQCAIRDGGRFRGFVGFDECTGLRMWTQDEIDMLSLISQVLTTFLLKKQAVDRDRRLALRLNSILDLLDAYVYTIKKDNFEVIYLNRRLNALDPSVKVGMICYQAFFDRSEPCEYCPLAGRHGDIYIPKYHLWARIRGVSMKWDDYDAFLLTCFDITEYKQAECPE